MRASFAHEHACAAERGTQAHNFRRNSLFLPRFPLSGRLNQWRARPFSLQPTDMRELMTTVIDREQHLRELAGELLFSMEKHGDRFTLTRTAQVERPEIESGLTLEQVENVLRRWKLRGLSGG
jgi:hypothetical protein